MKRFNFKILLITFLIWLIGCQKNGVSADHKDTSPDSTLNGYTLVWNDEFNGQNLDLTKWNYEVNGQGGGNDELQYYTAREENSYVKNGNLHIIAQKETYTGPDGTRQYTSARIRTLNKGDWKYGRFDIRAKLPEGQGLWPAIWMLPSEWKYGGWAASGEIDIMEILGQQPAKVFGTIHYGGTYPNNQHSGGNYTLPAGTFADSFHVFRLDWEPEEIRWYVDDHLYVTKTQWYSEGGEYPAPFDQKFHLLLNVAVGGNWPGDPDSTTVFPQTMQVDYVRVYKKNLQN